VTLPELTELAIGVVQKTIRKLPAEIRTLAKDLPVHYEAFPGEDIIAEGFEPDILGFFSGCPYGQELQQDNPTPPQIILFVESLWEFSEQDMDIYREEVRLTYLHELGHFLGWDEDEVAARGLD
jgi:predicted Zn-dependent protease with MMP-like domain